MRHQSSKAYDTLREGGIALPSQRTLRDYTHSCKAKTGFSNAVDQQLVLASRILTCEVWQEYVVVLVDEMYIRYVLLHKHSNVSYSSNFYTGKIWCTTSTQMH